MKPTKRPRLEKENKKEKSNKKFKKSNGLKKIKKNSIQFIHNKFNDILIKTKPSFICILCQRLLYPKQAVKTKINRIHKNYGTISCKSKVYVI